MVVDISSVLGAAIVGHPLVSGDPSAAAGKGNTLFADIVQALQALPASTDPVQSGVALPGAWQGALHAGGKTGTAREGGPAAGQTEDGEPEVTAGNTPAPWPLPGIPLAMSVFPLPAATANAAAASTAAATGTAPPIPSGFAAAPAPASLPASVLADASAAPSAPGAAPAAVSGQGSDSALTGGGNGKPAAQSPAAELAALRQESPQPAMQSADQTGKGEVARAMSPPPPELVVPKPVPAPAEGGLPPLAQPSVPPDKAVEAMARGAAPASASLPGVAVPLQSKEWATEFAQRVVWMAGQRAQFAEIAVSPPNLGGVEVRLSLNDHTAGAQFFSPHAPVREALEAALPRLRDMLAEAGISLGQAEVRDQAFAERGQWGFDPGTEPEIQGRIPDLTGRVARGQGLIDLYA